MQKHIINPLVFREENHIKPLKFHVTQEMENGERRSFFTTDGRLANLIIPSDVAVQDVPTLLEMVSRCIDGYHGMIANEGVQIVPVARKDKIVAIEKDEISNFRIIPYEKMIYINRKGMIITEREEILSEIFFYNNKREYLSIKTCEISNLCKIIKKRYSNTIIDYEVSNAEKRIETDFRKATELCICRECYFQHGWQIIHGQRVYVNDSVRLVGNVKIDTGLNLPKYDYTNTHVGDTLRYAFGIYKDSVSASTMITYSLMGVLYRCFKEAGFPPRFLLFLNGKTGSMKTTIGKILYTQICQDDKRDTPRRLDADTVTSFERALVLNGTDTITLIDDYSPAKTENKKRELADKLECIIRAVGDSSSKSRSNVKLEDCRGEGIEGMVVLTGELMGKGLSSNLRCLYCKMEREKVDEQAVTYFQNNPAAFTTVISHFADYVSCAWNEIVNYIASSFNEERAVVKEFLSERRIIDSVVTLRIACTIMCQFLVQHCGMDFEEIRCMGEVMRKDIVTNGLISQSLSTVESPSTIFIRALHDLMRINQIRLNNEKILQTDTTTYDGFEDDEFYYFNPESVYKKVLKFMSQTNRFFLLDLRELFVALYEDKIIKPSSNGVGKTYCARISVGNGKKQNFLKINKEIFEKVLTDSIEKLQE